VGDKCTYADLSFVPWYWLCPVIIGESFEKVSCMWFALWCDMMLTQILLGLGVQVPDQLRLVPEAAG
jgi:hypothetical protein